MADNKIAAQRTNIIGTRGRCARVQPRFCRHPAFLPTTMFSRGMARPVSRSSMWPSIEVKKSECAMKETMATPIRFLGSEAAQQQQRCWEIWPTIEFLPARGDSLFAFLFRAE